MQLQVSPGKYARIDVLEADGLFRKTYDLHELALDRSRLIVEAERRYRSICLYIEELNHAGANLPPMTPQLLSADDGVPVIRIDARLLTAPTAMIILARAETPEQASSVGAACFREHRKVLATMFGSRPIGYDAASDNFILDPAEGVLLSDVYPPRLGFELCEGLPRKLPPELCLLNYPERSQSRALQPAVLLRSYYTPDGSILYFLSAFSAALFARMPGEAAAAEALNDRRVMMLSAAVLELTADAFGQDLARRVEAELPTAGYAALLQKRLHRTPLKYRAAVGGAAAGRLDEL